MIQRYSAHFEKEVIKNSFTKIEFKAVHQNRYNISPLTDVSIITQECSDLVQSYTWGLVPASQKKPFNQGTLYNAYSEGIASKISFRIPIREKRCLILADSYYILRSKLDYYRVYVQNTPLIFMAGIYDSWTGQGIRINSCAILTQRCINRDIAEIHNINPVILSKEEADQWLDPSLSLPEVLALTEPKERSFGHYQIVDLIRDKTYQGSDLHKPLIYQRTLFD